MPNTPKVLIIIGDDYEDLELLYPKIRLIEAGCDVTVAGQEADKTYHGKHGYPCKSTAAINDLNDADFDALVLPGGWMPDRLRRDKKLLAITKAMAEAGKPIATICHGPQIDISAGIAKGVKYTSTTAIKDDLENAGAIWSDAEVVVDEKARRVSSRRPDDLPAFCKALLKLMGL